MTKTSVWNFRDGPGWTRLDYPDSLGVFKNTY